MKRILVVDVGGTYLKIGGTGHRVPIEVPSGPGMTAAAMVAAVRAATAGWTYEAVSIGYPGPIAKGVPAAEPRNLAPGWVGFGFRRAFRKPVRFLNDAAMQALGAYRGGRMLFLGLGTGLGTALVADGVVVPLEAAHLPYLRGETFEDCLGERGRRRLGLVRWRRHVRDVTGILLRAFQAEYAVLGGGASRRLTAPPPAARLGSNADAITGGIRLWDASRAPRATRRPRPSDPARRRRPSARVQTRQRRPGERAGAYRAL